jgi:hypothetical protein
VARNLSVLTSRNACESKFHSPLPTPHSQIFIICSLLFIICSCEQPFKAGLGLIIDLQAPTVTLVSPGAGAYIRGVTEFTGHSADDTKLESVWFQVANYPDVILPEYKTMDHKLGKFHKIADITGDSRKWSWKFTIDTARLVNDARVFSDGDFKLRLLVIDAATKEAITDEIAFYVKNNIPQIRMAFPSIVQGTDRGQLGGAYLNFGFIKNPSGLLPRAMDTKSLMVGMITDSEGINRSEGQAEITDDNGEPQTVKLFPPQIRFWQVDFSMSPGTWDHSGDYPIYPPGYLPPVKVNDGNPVAGDPGVAWEKLDVMETDVNNMQLTYPLPNVSGYYFGFEIRAQSSDKVYSEAYYPRSWLNQNYEDESPDFKAENGYVLIYVREPLEYPVLELYKLEDIYGAGKWNPSKGENGGYEDLAIPEPDKTDGNYEYLTNPIASKGGPFTLRIKASHSGGITSTRVFWEKDDKSAKGRFIWDPVDEPPYAGWTGGVVNGSYPFTMWGRNDPNVGGGATVRSYVFTYTDLNPADATAATARYDRVPDTDKFNAVIRNRSKLQTYTGPNVVEGRTLDFDDLPESMENWRDIYKLDEGTYNLSVYTTSQSGTRIAVPFTLTIFIDRKEPDLELNYIEGSAGEYYSDDGQKVTIVNGVVRPRFLLSDSRPVDTGFRVATSEYFERESGRFGSEQAYILIPANQKTAMDAYLTPKFWPFPNTAGSPQIPGVTISKHGPIFESSCLFKTSTIYYETRTDETGILPDGLYWLYAFGRDNAFNVGSVSYPIHVRQDSDYPEFDFSVGSVSVNVKEPDASYDYPASPDGKSFIINADPDDPESKRTNNKFTANSAIRVRIKDDDSLDLGEGPGLLPTDPNYSQKASNIKVTFAGSKFEAGKIVAYTDSDYIMELTDEEIKNAFTPQTINPVNNERRAVREILGTISQSMLLNRLKANQKYNYLFGAPAGETAPPAPGDGSVKHGFNSLPDGLYKISIDIWDDYRAKLKIDNADQDPVSRRREPGPETFWIAVDNKTPVIDTSASLPSGSFIASTQAVNILGTVTDANGPIKAEWAVYDGRTLLSGPTAPKLTTNMPEPTFTDDGLWKYDFAFPMDMNGNNGTFTYELKFQDRFGNSSTTQLRYSVDNEPPSVTLTKLIETFERVEDDVYLDNRVSLAPWVADNTLDPSTIPGYVKYVQLAAPSENKERLAVKVINFSLGALDNFKVEGIRWWLLPADVGSRNVDPNIPPPGDKGELDSSGLVLDYNAFPARSVADPAAQGAVYYSSDAGISGFDKGAYGVVNVVDRKFTITVNTQKMLPANGEYRLHIIAIDSAGNISRVTEDPVTKASTSSVFQTVFFLQEEDKPYFDASISPSGGDAADASVIGEKDLVVRGTIFENNGFNNAVGDNIWANSIQVWFAKDGGTATTAPDVLDRLLNKDRGDPLFSDDLSGYGYVGPVTINTGLGRMGRNLSLAFSLKAFTTAQIGGDGLKRYIIRATDSPINKLRENGTSAGTGDEGLRVSRWKQYSFIYDNVPPKVEVTSPAAGRSFGNNFGADFILRGYIEDANLSKTPDGRYYFDYYLDNDTTKKTFYLNEMDSVSRGTVLDVVPDPLPDPVVGKHIYAINKDLNLVTRVYFQIHAGEVSNGSAGNEAIMPNFLNDVQRPDNSTLKALDGGAHTLTLSVEDLSGKVASFMYNFIKDVEPPRINFTNIDNAGNKSWVGNDNWWDKDDPARRTWLRNNDISTIYYDTGRPILQGSFTDDVSNIAVTADVNSINIFDPLDPEGGGTGTFRYWIDYKPSKPLTTADKDNARTRAVIDGSGRNVRWSIYLTEDGTEGKAALPDGVHTIVIEVADSSGILNDDYYMIAFRIDSKMPKATIASDAVYSVFGSSAQQAATVFTISGTAEDANLKQLSLRITDKLTGNTVGVGTSVTFSDPGDNNDPNNQWTYVPFTTTGPEDKVTLVWKYDVTRTVFSTLDNGKSYDVKVIARDSAGNESEEAVWTFIVDASPPRISFNNLNTDTDANRVPADFIDTAPPAYSMAARNNINRLTSEELRIQGKVTDDYSAVREVQIQVWKWNWNTGTGTGVWTVTEPWTPVQNYADNKFKEVNWIKDFGSTLQEGLYRIQLRAKDESRTSVATNWDSSPPTGEGNPAESAYVYFYYDRTNPDLTVDGEMDNFYSTRLMQGNFVFSGTVKDENRFAKIEVKIGPVEGAKFPEGVTPYQATRTVTPVTPPDNLNQGLADRTWTVTFNDTIAKPDGRYQVAATVYDMTGRSYSVTKAFTLDNTLPGAKFTLPAKEAKTKYTGNGDDQDTAPNNTGFASVIVNGGETAVITGETWDKSDNNSESGIDQMWFRLGFIDGSAAFPTRTAIEADENAIISRVSGLTAAQVTALSVKDRNRWMDEVSEYEATGDADNLGNAWFKLGGVRKYRAPLGGPVPVPTGFVINNPNIYDWRMEIPNKLPSGHPDYGLATNGQIGGLKLYGSAIKIKGRNYVGPNVTDTSTIRKMARPVTGQAGVYRLPLWIRLVDKVGNVGYYCHDIFFYPDGDIPITSIENPSNGRKELARGGSISVDGVARSNTSVYDVIFRVFADGVSDSNLDGIRTDGTYGDTKVRGNLPTAADVVTTISNYDFVPIGSDTYNKIPTAYRNTNAATGSNSRWFSANLSLKGGSGEPLIPWSIILNTEGGGDITALIGDKGFKSSAQSQANDMIRVWLEVFVFNGEGAPIRSSIYQDDGQGTGGSNPLYGTADPDVPRPYVKVFYIKNAAPEITNPNVTKVGSTWSGSAFADWNDELPSNPGGGGYRGAGTEVRMDKFGIRAILDPNPNGTAGSDLGQVAFRTKLDGGAYSTWTTLWTRTEASITPNVNSGGVKIGLRDTIGSRRRFNFEYDIDSRAATTPTTANALAAINNGAWANTGGTITVEVRIRDNASPPNEATQVIQVGVDNFAPLAHPAERTNTKVAGTNVDFMGRVFDYARPVANAPISDSMITDYTPRKVDRIYAWFTKGAQYVNINTGATGTPTTRQMTALVGRAAAVVSGSNDTITSLTLTNRGTSTNNNITFPQRGGTEAAHNAAWVRELSESTATPGTGMLWSPVNSAVYDIRWSFTVDSTVLPDGALTLHYIVVDSSGNASYYTQETSVRNKYPQIDRVTLYTNNNGQGAAYTQDASREYVVNDYRSQMFNNLANSAEADHTGYLNSGFISKNQYLGFRVETSYGNEKLNFRLQHVKRERITLNRTNLAAMVAARESTANINLYTIAQHGDYSSARWKALGVTEDNPVIGTHFVLQRTTAPSSNPADENYYEDSTAQVWKYTPIVSITDVTQIGQSDVRPVVFGPDASFEFNGSGHFGVAGKLNNRIGEFNGSHPDADDSKPNSPAQNDTAFFLIRVWDTVNPENSTEYGGNHERWVNDQLYDALVVGMNVYLTDTEKPIARLYDLNPYTEKAVTGNNTSDANKAVTIRNAANPTAIGSNIVRGGLFNTKTERDMVRSGFINPRDQSKALDPVNGVYDDKYNQMISGVPLPDYPLKVSADTVPNSGTNRDKVSGRIILRGIAWDDQLIDEIQIKIGGDALKPILRLNTTTGKMEAVSPNQAYAVEELHWKTGHTVEWAYVWNTETEPAGARSGAGAGGPINDIQIQVIVKDKNSAPPGLTSTPVAGYDTGTTFHSQVNVDIVPYIPGFDRETPKSTTKRSLQGWYSFYQSEGNIAVLGYNFGTTAGTITLDGTSVGTVNGATNSLRTFSIPGNAASGAILLTTSAAAYNNMVDVDAAMKTKSWNREYNSYTPGSDLWINRPYAHIWRSLEQVGSGTGPGSVAGTIMAGTNDSTQMDTPAGKATPSMTLQYSGNNAGRLHAAWSVYNKDMVAYGSNAGAYQSLKIAGEPYTATDIDYYNGANNDDYQNNASVVMSYQRDGGPRLVLKTRMVYLAADHQGGGDDGGWVVGAGSPNSGGVPTSSDRWRNTRIRKAAASTADNNPGMVFITAFDALDKRLHYTRQSGTMTNSTAANYGNVSTQFFLDGGVKTGTETDFGGAAILAANINANNAYGNITRSNSAGQYSAIDYDSSNRPVIAYFDDQNQTLRLLYANSDNPTSAAAWTRRYVLPIGHALRIGSGSYVSMKIDHNDSNRIHLAFYNSTYKAVVYAVGTITGDFTASVIDRVVEGGQWTDISIDNTGSASKRANPWIVYADSSRTGNRDGARIAYKGAFGRALTDSVTGVDITGWEALTMPSDYQVNNDRLNIAVWPPTGYSGSYATSPIGGWNAAVGYGSNKFRIGYFFKPTSIPGGF